MTTRVDRWSRALIATALFTSLVVTPRAEAARTTKMYRMARQPYEAAAGVSMAQLTKAISTAIERSGWWPRVREPGLIEAEKSVHAGKHSARVEILFDQHSFVVRYLNSYNLGYDPERCRHPTRTRQNAHPTRTRPRTCREIIHPNYNLWVQEIENSVLRLVAQLEPGTPKPAVAATGPPAGLPPENFVADEIIKLQKLREQGVLTMEEFETQKRKLLSQ